MPAPMSHIGKHTPEDLGASASPIGLSQAEPEVSALRALIPCAIAFLEEAARHFEGRPTGGEDRAHWSNVYNAKNCRDIAALLPSLERLGLSQAIQIIRETRDDFLDEGYAIPQPVASFSERFACDQAAEAIERRFGLGTIEQRRLLGMQTPFDEYAASGMSAGTPDLFDRMSSMIRSIADGTIPTSDEGFSQEEAKRIVAEIDGVAK